MHHDVAYLGSDRRVGGRTLAGIFLLALAICGVHLWQMAQSPFFGTLLGDAEGYNAWARRIVAGEWVGKEVFFQAPLYPYLLALFYAVTGSDYRSVLVFQAVLHAVSCLLLVAATVRFGSRRAGIVAGFMLALYPAAIFHVGLLEKSTLDVFFVCLALWLLSLGLQRWTLGWWFWLGAVLGGLTLTRENSAVFLLAVLLWLTACRQQPWRSRGRLAGALLVGFILVLMPVALRNYRVGGRLFLTTSQFGVNFYIGNNERATGLYGALRYGRGEVRYERTDATRLAEQALGRRLSPAEVSRYWLAKSAAYIRSHPGQWLQLLARKAALACNAVEAMDTVDQYTHASWSWPLWLLDYCWHFGLLEVLAALGVWCTWREREKFGPLYLMLALYWLSLVAFYVTARYRQPFVPILILIASAGVTQAMTSWRGSSRTGKAVLLALLTAVTAAAHWPMLNAARMAGTTYRNYGKALLELKRTEEAAAFLQAAVQMNPDDAMAHVDLSWALIEQGKLEEAMQHCERALQLQPDFDLAHNNLGCALGRQGKGAEAIQHYERALQLNPDSALAHLNLGYELATQANLAEAMPHYERALQLNPDFAEAHVYLGEALAAQGKMAEASRHFEQAWNLATAQRNAALAEAVRTRLQAYPSPAMEPKSP